MGKQPEGRPLRRYAPAARIDPLQIVPLRGRNGYRPSPRCPQVPAMREPQYPGRSPLRRSRSARSVPRSVFTSRRSRNATLVPPLRNGWGSIMFGEETKTKRRALAGAPLRLLTLARVGLRVRPAIAASSESRNDERRPIACLGKNTDSRRHVAQSRMSAMVAAGAPYPSHEREMGFPTRAAVVPRDGFASKTSARSWRHCSHCKRRRFLQPAGRFPALRFAHEAIYTLDRAERRLQRAPRVFAATEAQIPQRSQPPLP
jgi:hypothetical protein